MQAWDKMIVDVEKIQKKRVKKSGMSSGLPFQLLFLHVGLQMLSEPQKSVEILEVSEGGVIWVIPCPFNKGSPPALTS